MPPAPPPNAHIAGHRGVFGAPRPDALAGLALPPARMPLLGPGGRPLKRWRYVGAFGPELMLCAGDVRVGPARQTFWAIWDRAARRLHERTRLGRSGVLQLGMEQPGRLLVRDGPVTVDLVLDEEDGVEVVCPDGRAYAWTRKQGGVRMRGTVVVDGVARPLDGLGIVDDSAGYHARRTAWEWCAGVGRTADGRDVAWNLVAGINDPPQRSERTVWVDGEPFEVGPAARFAPGLSGVATEDGVDLRFAAEAVRERRENLLLVRSEYRQPFGTFAGTLPGGAGGAEPLALAEGWGVMEEHSALW